MDVEEACTPTPATEVEEPTPATTDSQATIMETQATWAEQDTRVEDMGTLQLVNDAQGELPLRRDLKLSIGAFLFAKLGQNLFNKGTPDATSFMLTDLEALDAAGGVSMDEYAALVRQWAARLSEKIDPALYSLGKEIGSGSLVSYLINNHAALQMFSWRLGRVQNNPSGVRCVFQAVPEKEEDEFFGIIFKTGGEVVFTEEFMNFVVICVHSYLQDCQRSGRRTLDLDESIDSSLTVGDALRPLISDAVAEHLHFNVWICLINVLPRFWTELCALSFLTRLEASLLERALESGVC